MKKVIMFPGQGAQYKGMGKNLFSKYKHNSNIASEILGYDLEELCLKDPNNQLINTKFTQPALYVINSFNYRETNQDADFLVGHSLGEYNALLAAGAFNFETGLRLVQKRGELMAAATEGGMAAVLGLNKTKLRQKLKAGGFDDIDIANYNTPAQLVISGPRSTIKMVLKDFSKQDIRIVPLSVSAAFHSRYMKEAANQFSVFLKDFEFHPLKTPVISNVTAKPYNNNDISNLLAKQIEKSVKWDDTIQYLLEQEMSEFQEIGKGFLTRMVNEIKLHWESSKKVATKKEKPIMATKQVKQTSIKKQKQKSSLQLGSAAFRESYGISYSYIAGGMYRGTASKELVVRLGKANMMGFLGTGGMSLEDIETNIDFIQSELKNKGSYGMNFLHHLEDSNLENKIIELFLRKKIQNIEAAAFMQVTESLVYYRVSGLAKDKNGKIVCKNRILAKISRPEVAEGFMKPAPAKILMKLLEKGKITNEQAELAKQVPMSYDICVEADSGGHTDGGVALVLLPAIQELRKRVQKEYKYFTKIRVGLAGGIGTPQSAASAFTMGADFVLTGSINQCTVEAGTSDEVKDMLEGINVQDTAYAPAGDMFELGAKVQVLKKGVLFPARANKLYDLYNQYKSLEEIPEKIIAKLEKNYFKKSISEIWEETKKYLEAKGQTIEIERAQKNPRNKMALIFRWYFGFTSRIAFSGDLKNKVNFQIHTGPALGAFNQWVKGTNLESWRNRHVDEIGKKLMDETALLFEKLLKGLSN